jgi:Thioredoxin-like proteins and domains
MKEKIEQSIEGIRLMLQGHGGDIQLVSVDEENGIVTVALQGACVGCPHAAQTMKMGVEAKLMEDVPEIKEVKAV